MAAMYLSYRRDLDASLAKRGAPPADGAQAGKVWNLCMNAEQGAEFLTEGKYPPAQIWVNPVERFSIGTNEHSTICHRQLGLRG